jgi:hypothetical protein
MRRLALALLLGGLGATPSAAQVTLPGSPVVSSSSGPSAVLLDGQRLTLNVAFWPGDSLGPPGPPRGPFSAARPAACPPWCRWRPSPTCC